MHWREPRGPHDPAFDGLIGFLMIIALIAGAATLLANFSPG
jgi:hypothetical protein